MFRRRSSRLQGDRYHDVAYRLDDCPRPGPISGARLTVSGTEPTTFHRKIVTRFLYGSIGTEAAVLLGCTATGLLASWRATDHPLSSSPVAPLKTNRHSTEQGFTSWNNSCSRQILRLIFCFLLCRRIFHPPQVGSTCNPD